MTDAILHLVQQSPTASSALRDCLAVAGPADSIVLMHDGVYAAMEKPSAHTCYALQSDLEERGLQGRTDPAVTLIDYSGLVELCDQHRHNLSWF
ncbi:sulfur relay protein TusB/DsrH [Litorivivens lipolytica]|uniref:Sulfur relay protein TusB/DsrH n=1 Tax=Litorivivens lipolytica TaxID=1524264 RepID=A0A7W4W337_9GAMM|nr:sulfurtransferase complex subunit TusB [Litorivivens lipolytica]MBB3046555.1 sulfur relay protein TusB/DsrH [Litorivivens lipolytica]